MTGRTAAIFATLLVVVGVIAGLYLAGSPSEARLRRQDDRRETMLMTMDYAVRDYRSKHGHLPPVVDSVGAEWTPDSLRARDPVTGEPFEYRATGDSTYELCATFARATEGDLSGTWSHPAGRHCFMQVVK